MTKGKLAILVGVDGSGKTTLLNNLEKYGYKVSHWRRLKTIIPEKLNFDTPAEEVQKLRGKKRLDFIFKYISFEWEYLIYPSLQKGTDVVSDGFFIRFLVKEKLYKKLDVKKLEKLSPLTGKEVILMVDVPIETLAQRKNLNNTSPYEYLNNPTDFPPFQELQRNELLKYIKDFRHFILDGIHSKEKITRETIKLLKANGFYPSKV